MLRLHFSSASLFVRLLLLLGATVLSAQAVTFALVLLMPTPSPPTTPTSTIVSALQSGRSTDDRLRIAYGGKPADNYVDPSEWRLTTQIASALRIADRQVSVVLVRAMGGGSRRAGPPEVEHLIGPMLVGEGLNARRPRPDSGQVDIGIVTGRFEVAIEMPDGRWRQVSLNGGRLETWQLELLLWLLGSVAVVAPFAWFFAKRISEPIAALGAAARRIGSNPSGDPVYVQGPPEVAAASEAVNDMQRQIRRYVEDRTMMVGAIAHDLRTPLMRLSLRLQGAPDALRRASEEDISEIEQMATAALSFVRDLSVRDGRHRIALRSIVETVADEFADRDADVVLAPGEDAILVGDPGAIKRMVTNVVGNAVAYAGEARISLTLTRDTAVIAVADRGQGIPASEQERVFEPFYRVEQSRSRRTGGTGLGLASARAVARSHGGDIALANRSGGGLLVTMSLPL